MSRANEPQKPNCSSVGRLTKTYKDIFAPGFWRAWNDIYHKRIGTASLSGGRGSTKSTFVSEVILLRMEMARRRALKEKEQGNKKWRSFLTHAACFRKVGGTLADSCYSQFWWSADKLGILDKYTFRKTPLSIIRKGTGQRIYFRGLDDPQKARSIKPPYSYISDLWFEELSEYDGIEEIQDVTRSIQRGGHEFLTYYSYNPPETSSNWVNYKLSELERVDPTFRQYKSDYRSVPVEWLGEKFFRDAEVLRRLNERAYRHVYLGEITGNGGTVFPNVVEVDIPDSEIAKFDNVYWGADFGLRDPTVLLAVQYDPGTATITIFDEVFKPDMTLDEIEHEFNAHFGNSFGYIMGDSAAAQLILSLRTRGVSILPVEKYGDFRMMTTKWLQSLREIRIVRRRCPNAYREFVNCEYEKNKAGEFTGRIPDGNDHTIDSCVTGDTVVTTDCGPVAISELVGKEGLCLGYDEGSGSMRMSGFCNVRKTRNYAQTVVVRTADDMTVRCTPDHKLLEKTEGWIPAGVLLAKSRPRIMTTYGWSRVLAVDDCTRREDVFDLESPKLHSFATNGGIVVHNCRYALSRVARYYNPYN